jgi:hypothetical protein
VSWGDGGAVAERVLPPGLECVLEVVAHPAGGVSVQAVHAGDLVAVLSGQRAHLLRQLHALAEARATPPATAVESLLITAAELHIRADLGVVDAAEKTLSTNPAAPGSEQSSLGMTPPQSAAG